MSLVGHQTISRDARNRAIMPMGFRAMLPNKLLVTLDDERTCLLVFTETAFENYAQQQKEELGLEDSLIWERRKSPFLNEITIDSRGYFLLPKTLLWHVPFDKEIHIYGAGDKLALYPKERVLSTAVN